MNYIPNIEIIVEKVLDGYPLIWYLACESVCTKDDPWTPQKSRSAIHPDSICIMSGDYFDRYECPHCGKIFKEELPE